MSHKSEHSLLLVDDERAITKAIERLFRKEGHEVFTAGSGKEALELLEEMDKTFSLIISDQRMPGMTGSELLERAKEIAPDAIRILLTGFSDLEAVIDAVNRGEIHRYMTKPWNDADLLVQVRYFLEQYELIMENRRLMTLSEQQNRELRELNKSLEQKVAERTKDLVDKNIKLFRLNQDLEASIYDTVRAFSSLLDRHSPLLAGHGRRVSVLARDTARFLEMSEEDVTNIEVAALLHDIGKLGFPPHLMGYDMDKWNIKDKTMFRNHPQEGETTIQFIKQLDNVGSLIRHHHEQYDGQGFPDQLEEDRIPLGARIIAVADSYDNIINQRVHTPKSVKDRIKKNLPGPDDSPQEEILQLAAILHLKQHGFTRYDPDIVKAFLALVKEKGISFGRERKVAINALTEGMVLSETVYSSSKQLLLAHSTALTKKDIAMLKKVHKNDPITELISVVTS